MRNTLKLLKIIALLGVVSCNESSSLSSNQETEKSEAQGEEPFGDATLDPSTTLGSDTSPYTARDSILEDGGRVTDTFTGVRLKGPRVEIIFVLDGSESMQEEKVRLENQLLDFAARLAGGRSYGVEYEFRLIASEPLGFADPGGSKEIDWIERQVGSHNALSLIRDFLELIIAKETPKPVAREFIVVSDDDSIELNARDFVSFLSDKGQEGLVHVHGLVGLTTSRSTTTCQIAAPGWEYIRLSRNSSFGGVMEDICAEDWKPLFERLARVILGNSPKNEFPLSKKHSPGSNVLVKIDGKQIDPSQYKLITDKLGDSVLVFDKSVAPVEGAVVTVAYVHQKP